MVDESSAVSYEALQWGVSQLMWQRGEWAGCPVPQEGLRLSIEPKNPYAEKIMSIAPARDSGLEDDERLVNRWYCERRQCEVYVVHRGDPAAPSVTCVVYPIAHHIARLKMAFDSMLAVEVHRIDAELQAMQALSEHITAHQMRQYVALGYFMETSTRSGVCYWFRRGRPTVALRQAADYLRILCALCLHPIAYYETTHVGAMTPTADVLAHLLMMRGDEPMYWRRANQHPPHLPQAAL
jgi:hypothetical protein